MVEHRLMLSLILFFPNTHTNDRQEFDFDEDEFWEEDDEDEVWEGPRTAHMKRQVVEK